MNFNRCFRIVSEDIRHQLYVWLHNQGYYVQHTVPILRISDELLHYHEHIDLYILETQTCVNKCISKLYLTNKQKEHQVPVIVLQLHYIR